MCCCSLPSSGSASSCICGRASAAFSHALGGCTVAQPATLTATNTVNQCESRHTRAALSRGRKKRSYRVFARGFSLVEEPRLDGDHLSGAIDEVGARHARNVVGQRRLAVRVVYDREAGSV